MVIIADVFLFTVFALMLFIDSLVNGTLYHFGLQFSRNWAYWYQIYFDLEIALIVASIFLISALELLYLAEKGEEPDRISLLGRREVLVSTPEVSPLPQVTEEKTETSPRPSESVPLVKELSSVYCRYCGFENEPDAVFCQKCGKSMVTKNKPFASTTQKPIPIHLFCGACGAKNRVAAEYCKKCGKPLNQ